ncbi:riboflavin biosynthesis protein [Catellatospora sp. IY07-71]|uniref:bifunctional riboflavin kinase/FAD synthetase n=1 Tax=Catellatospora sp. IY07-71 TaxID=2728827 RepID=UPI001BB3E9EC|nr:bifunctional riboflavin kinase/FAD synthetase [Catellatospora sp. IY07-71]BCJ72006.1 riboflavin biosynthesis protein [Catellatospora sp. IY07-71]
MEHWQSAARPPEGWTGCVVTIGSFDGVHRGHQAVLRLAVARGRSLGLPVVVYTFDRHPRAVVRADQAPAQLTTPAERARLIAGLGVDYLVTQPFTERFAALAPGDFVQSVLVDGLNASLVVEGADFRFGRFAAGGVDDLAAMGIIHGFSVEVLELQAAGGYAGAAYSSTLARGLIAAGDLTGAREVLGRPHRVTGVAGRAGRPSAGRGRLTVRVDPYAALPTPGTYRGTLHLDGVALPARILVRPDAGEPGEVQVEVRDEGAGLAAVGDVALDLLARIAAPAAGSLRPAGVLP